MGKVSTATANHSEMWFAAMGSSGQQHSLSDRQCLGLLLKELSPHLQLLRACDSINLTV